MVLALKFLFSELPADEVDTSLRVALECFGKTTTTEMGSDHPFFVTVNQTTGAFGCAARLQGAAFDGAQTFVIEGTATTTYCSVVALLCSATVSYSVVLLCLIL